MISPETEARVRTWIESIHAEQPLLFVSHNEKQILELCDFAFSIAVPGVSAQSGNHPDAIRIIAEKTTITVKDIRVLKATLAVKSSSGKRIICIPHAEQLLPESANMLLKTLEESSKDTRYILGTPAKRSVLSTIRSRCIIIPLIQELISASSVYNLKETLAQYTNIRESAPYTEGELRDIARLIRTYALERGSNPALARTAMRLRDYYRTQKTSGGNIKIAGDVLLASLAELQKSPTL